MRPPRPFTRDDGRQLVELLYYFHMRAIDEEKYEVAKRASLVIVQISQHTREIEKHSKL